MAAPKHEAKSEPKREVIVVPAAQGQYVHPAETAEGTCSTAAPAKSCTCGLYELEWATAAHQAP